MHPKCEIIVLFSIFSHVFFALPTVAKVTVFALNLFAAFLTRFVHWFTDFFLYCSPYSHRSSNYCKINSWRSFFLLKAISGSIRKFIAIALKSDNYRQSNKEKKQRNNDNNEIPILLSPNIKVNIQNQELRIFDVLLSFFLFYIKVSLFFSFYF